MGKVQNSKKKTLSSKRKNRRLAQLRRYRSLPERGEKTQTPDLQSDIEKNIVEENDNTICHVMTENVSVQEALPELEIEDITSKTPDIGHIQHEEISLEGRRVVDIGHLFRELVEIGKHCPFDCSFSDMYPIRERRMGLNSTITLQCKMCNITKSINLCDPTTNMDVNKGLVLGSISTGSGYTGSEELFTSMNIPFMAPATFYKYENIVSNAIHNITWKTIEDAGREEAEMAKNLGEVDKNGIPFITVVADGAWSKRSYSVNYDAKSGVACIIGARTKKILFLAIRNKYCSVCFRAESKNVEVSVHECYKNWSSTSTSMESDIIVEGFKRSIEMHGVIYKKLVGDGDSSVYCRLLESRPYGNVYVEKIECRNHLLRNFSKKIKEICGRKRSNSKNVPVAPSLRKLVEKNALRLRTAIKYAVLHRTQEDIELGEKINSLKKDLSNVASHVFGEHSLCSELQYFNCKKEGTELNHIPAMKECGLFSDIEVCFNRLIYNAESLIINMDTNIAEQYNSIVCKFVGGKRINFSGRRSYITRCESAATSFNTKGNFLLSLYDEIAYSESSTVIKRFTARMKRRRQLQEKRIIHRKRKTVALPDKHYGLEPDIEPDLTEDQFRTQESELLNNLQISNEKITELEVKTRGQNFNSQWHRERHMRLTASHFGEICKMRLTTSCENKVKHILYPTFKGNAATKYGTDNEPLARQQFEHEYNVKVIPCGLFVDIKHQVLAASPDGIIGTDGILEIKCPKLLSQVHPKDAIKRKMLKFCTLDDNESMVLNENHNYYYQVQGQLHITRRKYCYFVVWSPIGMLVQKINKDDQFWKEKMESKLLVFYYRCLLPELVDPRHPRNLKIRNPPR